jgi:GT2 family glycosyltransferase
VTAPPRVSIIVVADGPWDETFRCLTALAQGAAGVPHEVIVVDDGTSDETAAALARLPGITSLRGDVPQGFAAAASAGASHARAPLLAFLHADAAPHPGWLAPLVRLADADPAIGAVSSRLLGPSGLVEADGVIFTSSDEHPMVPVAVGAGEPGIPSLEVSEVPAASCVALLVRREPFEAVGGFDQGLGGAAPDLDLCFRLRARGLLVLVARESVAVHQARCSGEISDGDIATLTQRWLAAVPLAQPVSPAAGP